MTRSLLILLAALGIAAVGVLMTPRLRLDARLEALLPAESKSVLALERLRERLGIDEPLTVLISSDEPQQNEAIAEKVGEQISRWPETVWVMTDYGVDELVNRAFYYIDLDTLEEWNELAEEVMDWEVCKASPFCVTIADPPKLPTEQEIRETIDRSEGGRLIQSLTGASAAPKGEGESSGSNRLCDDEGRTCAVQALMSGSPGDLAFARRIKGQADEVLESVVGDGSEDLQAAVSGRYRNATVEHEITRRDLRRVSFLALAGLLVVVMIFFRDPRALVQLAIPLLSGLAASVGLIALIEPNINLISAAALAILAGMGIDFGIHLLMHYRSARAQGEKAASAARSSVRSLWVSLLVAGLTTACGFAALSITEFQGFSQMGWMASLGIIVCLVWALLTFPRAAEVLPGNPAPEPLVRAAKPASRRSAAGLLVGLTLLSIPLAFGLEFESNLRKLRPAEVSHGIASRGVMRARDGISVYALSDRQVDLDAALSDPWLGEAAETELGTAPTVVSAHLIFPPDADEKTALFEQMSATLERAREKARERDDQDLIAELNALEPWLDVDGPPRSQHLPPWLASTLIAKDGDVGHSGVLYLRLRGSDARAMEKVARWLERIRDRHPNVTFASAPALLGEITPALSRDAPWILMLVFMGLIVATAIATRSFRFTRDVFLATALTGVVFAAALSLLGLKLHLYNLLAIPVVIGLAVDGAVHVRWSRKNSDPSQRYATYKAVAASTVTSLVAFASLLVASNPGLRSLGLVAMLGLAISLAVNLLWLRAWCPVEGPAPTAVGG